jgi:DNA-binding response OmpR family regulator
MDVAILVVDDERSIRILLQRVLTQAGYRVDAVADTLEAERQLATTMYCGIIIDYNLPLEDGISFLRRLQRQTVEIPTILISGQDISTIKSRASDLPIGAFLTKPFDLLQLIDIVHAVCRPVKAATL